MINRRDVLSLGALASVGLAMASRAETIPTTATTADKSPINKGKSVRGTQTEKCLLKAFAGESQARMRYTIFAQRINSRVGRNRKGAAGHAQQRAENQTQQTDNERGGKNRSNTHFSFLPRSTLKSGR